MDQFNNTTSVVLVGLATIAVCLVLFFDDGGDTEDEVPFNRAEATACAMLALRRARAQKKRSRDSDEASDDEKKKSRRRSRRWDHTRARLCVQNDYWGPQPLFDDKTFTSMLRVNRSVAETLLSVCENSSVYFTQRSDGVGREGLCPKVKIICALKCLAYGASPSAFQDYCQMGATTGRECLKKFVKAISESIELRSVYLRHMERSDAVRLSRMHAEYDGIPGRLASLDCMHIAWKNCPVAWQGAYQGKEKKATLVLEAAADRNLWLWHANFGSQGSLNDINIWNQSPLLRMFEDGTFTNDIDCEYTVGGEVFSHFFFLVDGIYPELSRFVKTIDEAAGLASKRYAKWQEGSRKDIERAFGVLQRKFFIVVKAMELWYKEEIAEVVMCCVILHNMMVAERLKQSDEPESSDWYWVPNNLTLEEEGEMTGQSTIIPNDTAAAAAERQKAELQQLFHLQSNFYDGPAILIEGDNN